MERRFPTRSIQLDSVVWKFLAGRSKDIGVSMSEWIRRAIEPTLRKELHAAVATHLYNAAAEKGMSFDDIALILEKEKEKHDTMTVVQLIEHFEKIGYINYLSRNKTEDTE